MLPSNLNHVSGHQSTELVIYVQKMCQGALMSVCVLKRPTEVSAESVQKLTNGNVQILTKTQHQTLARNKVFYHHFCSNYSFSFEVLQHDGLRKCAFFSQSCCWAQRWPPVNALLQGHSRCPLAKSVRPFSLTQIRFLSK